MGSGVVVHGLWLPAACGIFPNQWLNPCLQNWQAIFFIHCTIREVPIVINTLKCQFLPFLLTSHRWGTVLLIPRLYQVIQIHKIWCWRCSVGPSAKWKCEAQWGGKLSLCFPHASCPNLCLGVLSTWVEFAPPCPPGCPSNVRWCCQDDSVLRCCGVNISLWSSPCWGQRMKAEGRRLPTVLLCLQSSGVHSGLRMGSGMRDQGTRAETADSWEERRWGNVGW